MRFIILLTFFGTLAMAQTKLELRKANNLYNRMEYASAIPFYEAALEKSDGNVEAMSRLADSYRKINDSRHAERIYKKVIATNPSDPEIYLHYAESLTENGKYDTARQAYSVYGQKSNNDARAQNYIKALDNLAALYKDSSKFKVEYLSINSPQADFSPVFYKNGLVFSSGRKQGSGSKTVFKYNHSAYLDLYFLNDTSRLKRDAFATDTKPDTYPLVAYDDDKKDHKGIYGPDHTDDTHPTSNDTRTVGYYNTTFSSAKATSSKATEVVPFSKKLNSKYHEGSLTFSPSGDTVYFTRNNYNKHKYKKSKEGINKLKIYSAVLKEGEWTNIQDFPFNDDQYSVGHPTLSADGRTMFFTSDMPGGSGGTDLWYTKKVDTSWSKPQNAGAAINTAGQEMFPYLDREGNLFYSSDGLGGLGGLDLFQAENAGKSFSKPVNMGFPINSKKDDFGITASNDGSYGFLSSNRKSGGYDDDIYSFAYSGPVAVFIQALIVDKETGIPLTDATVKNELLGTVNTDRNGKVVFANAKGGVQYNLGGEKIEYNPNSATASTTGLRHGDTLKVTIPLEHKLITVAVKGIVKNEDGKPVPDVKVKLVNKCTGAIITSSTVADGQYQFSLNRDSCYLVVAEKPNCGTITTSLSTNDIHSSQVFEKDFEMLCKGDIVQIDNIYYDRDKDFIRPDAATELEKILPMLNKYPNMRIELRSHTDCRASDAYNLALSDRRAKSAAKYLVSKGIVSTRIVGKGYGEILLLNKCHDGVECTEEEHQVNRRTEFKILTMGKSNAVSKKSVPASELNACQCEASQK